MTQTGFGDDPVDRLGHGTAVAAAIREKAPSAELYSVKVFSGQLTASMATILRALAWCRDQKMDLINLSLGTSNAEHQGHFLEALEGNGLVVSAADLLPGILPGVIGVGVDESCPRDQFLTRDGRIYASPFPRPIEGVPASRNLQGVSFAVANVTGLIAQMWPVASQEEVLTKANSAWELTEAR